MSEGYCPVCGAGIAVNFKKADWGYEGLTVPIKCSDCGFVGYEQHMISFCCHLDKDGEEIEYNDDGTLYTEPGTK